MPKLPVGDGHSFANWFKFIWWVEFVLSYVKLVFAEHPLYKIYFPVATKSIDPLRIPTAGSSAVLGICSLLPYRHFCMLSITSVCCKLADWILTYSSISHTFNGFGYYLMSCPTNGPLLRKLLFVTVCGDVYYYGYYFIFKSCYSYSNWSSLGLFFSMLKD